MLSIKDMDKFTRAVESNTLHISDLLHSEEGIGAKIKDVIDDFVNASGTISNNKKSLDSEIRSLNDRIKYMNEALERRERQLTEEFSKLQETMVQMSNQQSFFSLFTGGTGYSYY
jgi:flagellar capping protein FliD